MPGLKQATGRTIPIAASAVLVGVLWGGGLASPPLAGEPAQLGAYLGGGCVGRERLPAFERWLGREVDRLHDGLAQDSWAAMVGTASYVTTCWQGVAKEMTLTLPMLPKDGSTITDGAQGKFDKQFHEIATVLVARGYGNAIIRIGPEFNAPWFQWSANAQPDAWVAYWRRIVTAMRGVPNARFRFDWCPILGVGVKSPLPAYPGDSYVDFVGADVYNVNWDPRVVTAEQRWKALQETSFGLQWHSRFAAEHGKPMTYPEWGTGTRPDGHGGGDDSLFVERMAGWIRANNVAYHLYWDFPAADYNAKLSDGSKPAAAAAFLKAFGGVR